MAKANRTFSTPTSNSADPLIEVEKEIRQLSDRTHALELLNLADKNDESTQKWYRESESRNVSDREYILRDYVTTLQATSIEGAIVQVGELARIFDLYRSSSYPHGDEEDDERKITRLLFSIETALRAAVPTEHVKDFRPMDNHIDPFKPFEEQLALIKRDARDS